MGAGRLKLEDLPGRLLYTRRCVYQRLVHWCPSRAFHFTQLSAIEISIMTQLLNDHLLLALSPNLLTTLQVLALQWEASWAPCMNARLALARNCSAAADKGAAKGDAARAQAVTVPSTIAHQLRSQAWLPSHAGALLPPPHLLVDDLR